jgi:hypothetical protein
MPTNGFVAVTLLGLKAMNAAISASQSCRDRLGACIALTCITLLAACAGPPAARAAEDPPAISDQKVGDICAEELSYDVTGPYYASCRNYLRRHAQAQPVAVHPQEPAEHRACEQIGLAKDSPDYRRCVQELNLLDISSDHL